MVIDPSGAYFRPEGKGFICGISPPADQDPECFDFEVQHALFDEVLWPLLAARPPRTIQQNPSASLYPYRLAPVRMPMSDRCRRASQRCSANPL